MNIIGLKIPNWRGADQLAIYKQDRGVDLVACVADDGGFWAIWAR